MSETTNLPSREMLESMHQFPGTFLFKVIGTSDQAFLARVLIAARTALGMETDPPFTVRQTPQGRHMAISLQPDVANAGQVLDVYRAIAQVEGLVLLI